MLLQSEIEKLLGEIETAFGAVRLGEGVSLHQARAMDDYMSPAGIAAARCEDTEERWQDITDEKLDFFSDTLAFMDAAGFRFHMPRFMVYALTHPHSDSFATDAPIYRCDFNEDSKEYALSRFALLSIEQCRAIRRFLWFAAEHDDSFDGRVALQALEKYWDRFE